MGAQLSVNADEEFAEYEGLADEIILMRLSQLGEPTGAAAWDDLFDLACRVATAG